MEITFYIFDQKSNTSVRSKPYPLVIKKLANQNYQVKVLTLKGYFPLTDEYSYLTARAHYLDFKHNSYSVDITPSLAEEVGVIGA
jgi:hypothetical protein